MKKLLLSLVVVGAVASAAVLGTIAYFSDTETSIGNSFATGTIDIAVDDQNPWTQTQTLNVIDMKPSQVEYSEYVIQNVGSNPANVTKRVDVTGSNNAPVSEPECVEETGTYANDECTGNTPKSDIDTVIRYDMRVWVYDVDPVTNPTALAKWWQVIYTDDMAKMLSTVNGQNILLGMIPSGWYMKVQQSYHMDSATTNWAQGDSLTFNVTLTADQLKNTVTMMEKSFVDSVNPTFVYGGNLASVTYGVKDDKFNYTLNVTKAVNGNYTLIAWDDSANGYAFAWGNVGNAVALSNVTVAGGVASKTDSIELGRDLINAKFWLVGGTFTPGSAIGSLSWSPANWMFETALADYYNSL